MVTSAAVTTSSTLRTAITRRDGRAGGVPRQRRTRYSDAYPRPRASTRKAVSMGVTM